VENGLHGSSCRKSQVVGLVDDIITL
jgi:hypothetical protein